MTKIAPIFLLLIFSCFSNISGQERTYFKDNSGRTTGSVTTTGQTTIYRNSSGQVIGRAKTLPSGRTYFYDKTGKPSGSVSGRFNPKTMKPSFVK